MGNYIEVNDTLQITEQQGFPVDVFDLENHLKTPVTLEDVRGRVFSFQEKPRARVFHLEPEIENATHLLKSVKVPPTGLRALAKLFTGPFWSFLRRIHQTRMLGHLSNFLSQSQANSARILWEDIASRKGAKARRLLSVLCGLRVFA